MQNLPETQVFSQPHGKDTSNQYTLTTNYTYIQNLIAQYTGVKLDGPVLNDIISAINTFTGSTIT